MISLSTMTRFLMWTWLYLGSQGPLLYSTPFPIHPDHELQIQFWINVFTRYSVNDAVIHDAEKPERIYQILHLREDLPDSVRQNAIESARDSVASILKMLGSGEYEFKKLPPFQRRIYLLFGHHPSKKDLIKASEKVRTQGGMMEQFFEGLLRSGKYIKMVREVFKAHGLPEDLVYLAHVESSFNPYAISKYGATGMWQITRGTGREFLTINDMVDERRDPRKSTIAAAKILKKNYESLQSWPLAMTAYNHGLNGMRRAVKQVGSNHYYKIYQKYRGRLFGFASKNFYFEFLAAKIVAENASAYFGDFQYAAPVSEQILKLESSIPLVEIQHAIDVEIKPLLHLNPALGFQVTSGKKPIPKGSWIRIPSHVDVSNLSFLTSVESLCLLGQDPASEMIDSDEIWFDLSYLDFVYRDMIYVHSTETLGHYADWLQVPVQTLRKMNGLKSDSHIEIGQRIKLRFSEIDSDGFIQKRKAYHQNLQARYFQNREFVRHEFYRMGSEETLWHVAKKKFDLPVWLMIASNGWVQPYPLAPGDSILVPVIKEKDMQ